MIPKGVRLNLKELFRYLGVGQLLLDAGPRQVKECNMIPEQSLPAGCVAVYVKSVQSALTFLLTTFGPCGTFSCLSTRPGCISIIELLQFTIVRFFWAS